VATFLDLKTDVNEIAARTVADYAYTALTSELNARLRLVDMEVSTTISATTGTSSYAISADVLETINLRATAGGITTPIILTNEFDLVGSLDSSGRPVEAVITDGFIAFNPTPDQDYTISHRTINRLAALSADGDTNDVLTNHYNVYLYGALKHWTALTRDIERMQHWSGLFEEAVTQAEATTARARYGTESAAVMPPQRGVA
jgi:hypothetical protein